MWRSNEMARQKKWGRSEMAAAAAFENIKEFVVMPDINHMPANNTLLYTKRDHIKWRHVCVWVSMNNDFSNVIMVFGFLSLNDDRWNSFEHLETRCCWLAAWLVTCHRRGMWTRHLGKRNVFPRLPRKCKEIDPSFLCQDKISRYWALLPSQETKWIKNLNFLLQCRHTHTYVYTQKRECRNLNFRWRHL